MTRDGETAGGLLVTAHETLVAMFVALNRADETIVAAHLLAAIDAIEDRLDVAPMQRRTGLVAQLAEAMIEAFADRAEAVARGQLVGSTGSAFLAWAAIVTRIGGHRPLSI